MTVKYKVRFVSDTTSWMDSSKHATFNLLDTTTLDGNWKIIL